MEKYNQRQMEFRLFRSGQQQPFKINWNEMRHIQIYVNIKQQNDLQAILGDECVEGGECRLFGKFRIPSTQINIELTVDCEIVTIGKKDDKICYDFDIEPIDSFPEAYKAWLDQTGWKEIEMCIKPQSLVCKRGYLQRIYSAQLKKSKDSLIEQIILGDPTAISKLNRNTVCIDDDEKFNDEFTNEQKRCVQLSLQKAISVVFGPPGCGKTTAMIASIIAHIQLGRRILIVTTKNVLLRQLMVSCYNTEPQIFQEALLITARKYGDVTDNDIPSHLFLHAKIRAEIERSSNEQYKLLQNRRRSGNASFDDENQLRSIEIDIENTIIRKAKIIFCTLGVSGQRRLTEFLPDTLIIDEICAANQADIACAVALKCNWLTVFGDRQQLKPFTHSVYAKHGITGRDFAEELVTNGVPCTELNVNFRNPSVIVEMVSSIRYNGQMKSALSWTDTNDPRWPYPSPLIIEHVPGEEQKNRTGSTFNTEQANFAVEVMESWIKFGIKQNEIAILTPYRAMADFINTIAKTKIARTIDSFQGLETNFVIIALAREHGNISHLKDLHRFCVMLTRCKKGICILSNLDLIENQYPYTEMIQYAAQKGKIYDFVRTMSQKQQSYCIPHDDDEVSTSRFTKTINDRWICKNNDESIFPIVVHKESRQNSARIKIITFDLTLSNLKCKNNEQGYFFATKTDLQGYKSKNHCLKFVTFEDKVLWNEHKRCKLLDLVYNLSKDPQNVLFFVGTTRRDYLEKGRAWTLGDKYKMPPFKYFLNYIDDANLVQEFQLNLLDAATFYTHPKHFEWNVAQMQLDCINTKHTMESKSVENKLSNDILSALHSHRTLTIENVKFILKDAKMNDLAQILYILLQTTAKQNEAVNEAANYLMKAKNDGPDQCGYWLRRIKLHSTNSAWIKSRIALKDMNTGFYYRYWLFSTFKTRSKLVHHHNAIHEAKNKMEEYFQYLCDGGVFDKKWYKKSNTGYVQIDRRSGKHIWTRLELIEEEITNAWDHWRRFHKYMSIGCNFPELIYEPLRTDRIRQ